MSKRDFNFRFTIKGFVLTKDGLDVDWFLKNMRTHTAKDKKPEETSHGLDEYTGGTGEGGTDE